MGIWQKIKQFHRSRKKYIVTIVLLFIVIVMAIYAGDVGAKRGKLDYSKSLDLVAARVNGTELSLRSLAFYVAYEEAQVQEQALVYNPEDTSKYWNLHVDGIYIRVAARNAAIQMGIHDELFYEMAVADGIELNREEEEALASAQEDFCADLWEDGRTERLGVSEEDICASMRKAALAEKYQSIYAQLTDKAFEDYSYGQGAYEELLEQQDYEICKNVWSKIDMGNITLDHESAYNNKNQ